MAAMSDTWLKWKAHTDSLRSALATHHRLLATSSSSSSSQAHLHSGDGGTQASASNAHITELLVRCLDLYKKSLKSDCQTAALSSMSGHEHSPMEAAFFWLGGWRPTSAITLVYSTLGLHTSQSTLFDHDQYTAGGGLSRSQREHLLNIRAALLDNRLPSSHASGQDVLSDAEVAAMESLRRQALGNELHLSNELASFQMLLPDQTMVEALTSDPGGRGHDLMEARVSQLVDLLAKANRLRVDTLETLLDLLNPSHSALCCISAFELVHAMKSLH